MAIEDLTSFLDLDDVNVCETVNYDGPNGSFFYLYTNSQYRIPNSEFRMPKSEFRIRNSAFRKKRCGILHFEKNVVGGNFVFGDATSGSVHGLGPFDLKLEQFKQ